MNSVYIDSAVASSPIYLGPNNASSVIIGNTNCRTFVNGLFNASSLDVASTGTLNIGSSLTTGTLSIGQGNVTTGSIYIGAGNGNLHTGPITIGTTGTATTIQGATMAVDSSLGGTINVGSSQTAVGSAINIGGNANRLGVINIGTGGSGTMYLGNTNNIVNVNGTLAMGSTRNITLKTDGALPTAQTQLGGITSVSITTSTVSNNSTYATITITTPGIYIFAFGIHQSYSTLGTTNHVNLTGANVVTVNYGYSKVTETNQISFTGTQVVRATASDYKVVLALVGGTYTTATQGGYFSATRIG